MAVSPDDRVNGTLTFNVTIVDFYNTDESRSQFYESYEAKSANLKI